MKGLKHDAHPAAAETGGGILAHPGDVGAGNHHAPAAGPLQPGRHHQKRRFAGAGRAGQGDGFTGGHGKRNPMQDIDRTRRARQRQRHLAQRYGWQIGGQIAWLHLHIESRIG